VDFFPLLKEFLLASFQLGLLMLQLLLVGYFTAAGVGQHAHTLRIRGQQFSFAFFQLAIFGRKGLVGESELLSGEVSFFA
jgi:hypothetical protein